MILTVRLALSGSRRAGTNIPEIAKGLHVDVNGYLPEPVIAGTDALPAVAAPADPTKNPYWGCR